MKRIIVASAILSTIIIFCTIELFFLNKTVAKFKNDINNIVNLVSEDKKEEAIKNIETLIESFDKKHVIISTFIDHEPLKQIEINFYSMKKELEQDSMEDFFIESEESLINLEHLKITEQPSIGNIL